MNGETQEKQGNIKNREAEIAACVSKAVHATEGVSGLAGTRVDRFTKSFLPKDSLPKGIRLSKGERGIELDVSITVDYGSNIPAVCWDLQKNNKRAVESCAGEETAAIHIHVRGVRFPQETEEEKYK